jgi:hypothetical protein
MATRSTIAVEHADGTISSIYCHWDGYLSNNGSILFNKYDTLEEAEALLKNGNLSILGVRIDPIGPHSFDNPEQGTCVYYGRDRGEFNQEPVKHSSFIHYKFNCDLQDYNYFFKDGVWYVHYSLKNKVWVNLEDALINSSKERSPIKERKLVW